ncbi:MAG: YggS family pyridoxal phosphate-dependent enzyme [Oscillospiraceae bacterium]|nr:YggS family pyridoxal phosphate-dependent enzyme [Oscillospiraceae bacterium]
MNLEENICRVRENIARAAREVGRDPGDITLVAATKTQTDETIRRAIAAGITVCGENRVQELVAHLEQGAYGFAGLHFIGHLQTNKVKYVAGRVDLIESVDSLRLLEAIEERCTKLDVVQPILVQVNIGREESKSGVHPEEAEALVRKALDCPHVKIRGLMAIPPAATAGGSKEFFTEMAKLFVDIKQKMNDNKSDFNCLSMGMSGDYPDAVRAGATHVRVGSAIFGPRPPKAVAG